jgi:septal ring-binding cell division protein DamX
MPALARNANRAAIIGPMRTGVVIVVAAVALVGGCGGEEPTLGKSSADELHAQVAAVRSAAADGDRAAALEALDGLSGQVRDLEAGGSLAEADAAALRRGIGRARRKVREEVAAPAATATATPEPTATATPAPEQGKPAKPGKGHGKAKGKARKGKGG